MKQEVSSAADQGAVTDEHFWDDQWETRGQTPTLASFLRSGDHGPRGRFLKVLRAVAGADFSGRSVVELGGASSRFLVDLAGQGARVTAIDYSPVGIEQTREMFARHGIDGAVIEADMFEASDRLGKYDLVTHWGLVEHFEDPTPVLKVSADLVDEGGLLVFTMPNMEAAGAALWKFFAPANFGAHILHDDQAIIEAARKAGLEPVRFFHSGPPLVRMAPAERLRFLALGLDALHAAGLALAKLFPGLFIFGSRSLSDTRGFVFRRSAAL